MPANTTVSHVSPLLSYIPRSAWFEGTPSDPDLWKYSSASYHANNNTRSGNASLTFSWWGTDIWVYGGYRKWSGEYHVILDGHTTLHSGYVAGTKENFNHVLFNSSGLSAAKHHIRIVNASNDPRRPTVDINQIVFQSTLEESGMMYHSDPQCSWYPDGAWQANDDAHFTNDSIASMAVSFKGSGIVLYGYINQYSAPLTVTIDGQTSQPLFPNTAIAPQARGNGPQVLFAATDLNEGNHTLTVENDPTDIQTVSRGVNLAYGRILTVPGEHSGMQPPSGPESPPLNGLTNPTHRTAVLAGSFGTLGLLLLALLLWRLALCARRKIRQKRDNEAPRPFFASPDAVTLARARPMHTLSSFSSAQRHPYAYSRMHRSQRSYSAHAHAHAPDSSGRIIGGRADPERDRNRDRDRDRDRDRTDTRPLVGDSDTPLGCSFSRMVRPRRPPPVNVAIAGPGTSKRWRVDASQFSPADPDPDDDVIDINIVDIDGEDGAEGERDADLHRRPTNGTWATTSPTVFDSMSVHAPLSPYSPRSPSSPDPDPDGGSHSRPHRATSRQRVRVWRDSIEKPPLLRLQRQLVGSPVGSLPSSRVVLPLPPQPPLPTTPPPLPPPPLPVHYSTSPSMNSNLRTPPPPPLPPPPGLEFELGWPVQMPPPYRFLDKH